VLAADHPGRTPACAGSGCLTRAHPVRQWAVPLTGSWSADVTANGGTEPASGQAYVGVGGGLAALGAGLELTAYTLASGARQWQTALAGPAGAQIVSVRAWTGVVTVGLLAPGGRVRTEVVLSARTGAELHRFPAAVLGGAVAASAAATVVLSSSAVTSYDNATGRVRWRRPTGGSQSWQVDGQTLYLAESAGGVLGSSPVTALRVVNLADGTERTLSSPVGQPFSGSLALAADGVVLFASAAGVTAYSGSAGGALWTRPGAVAEGSDPEAGLVYLAVTGGTLRGDDPATGRIRATVPASAVSGAASVYVVRAGTAFGLDAGANGAAWEYSTAAGRVSWTSAALPWPHFFADLSGLGGSAPLPGETRPGDASSASTVVVTACPHLIASSQDCSDPELVAFRL
jgi:outer membrane protein assembly factor BamB